jgi:FMN phosphatase YigB (HAD superfamily)
VAEGCFASPAETAVIFDFDDTLFPTTHMQERLHLDMSKKLAAQKSCLPWARRGVITSEIAACENSAIELVRMAHSRGHVFIVTLARTGWVRMLCTNYFPKFWRLLSQLGIRIIYAKEIAEKAGLESPGRQDTQMVISRRRRTSAS